MAIRFNVETYFNAQPIIDRLGAKMARAMAMAGGYARKHMQINMARGGKKRVASKPGEFPRGHRGDLRRFISYNPTDDGFGMVIGPTPITRAKNMQLSGGLGGGSPTVPEILTYGGTVTHYRKRRRKVDGKRRTITVAEVSEIEPRPFVQKTTPVAVEKMLDNIEKLNL